MVKIMYRIIKQKHEFSYPVLRKTRQYMQKLVQLQSKDIRSQNSESKIEVDSEKNAYDERSD